MQSLELNNTASPSPTATTSVNGTGTSSTSILCTPSSALVQSHPDHTHNATQCCSTHPQFVSHSISVHHADADADAAANFDCNICLDVCYDPVVTMCGHLFCWPCLYHWLSCSTHSESKDQICPVCKQNVENMMVIPLYGRGRPACADNLAERFPGIHVPCRPSPPRLVRTSQEQQFASLNYTLEQVNNVHHDQNQLHQSLNLCLSRLYNCLHSTAASSYTLSSFFCAGGSWIGSERRRFNNEKEFVLHWGFIVLALLATLAFVLC